MSAPDRPPTDGRFAAHARTVALLTFVSRITGLGRDAVLSRLFGAGVLMDAFFFAFLVPNLFRRLFGEGALSAAFLPEYARLHRDDPDAARRLASLVAALVTAGLGAVVLVAEIALLMLGDGEDASPARRLLMIMLPYTPLVCLVAVLGAMLQVHGRFGPTAAAPVILNLAMIAAAALGAAWWGAGARALSLVAAAVVLAGLAQVAWSLGALGRAWWTTAWSETGPALRRVAVDAAPMMVGLGVFQLNTALDGLIASYPSTIGPTIAGVPYPLETGAMAAVSYAQRLYQFPLGVFGVALATAIFPALARQADDGPAFAATLRRGLRLAVFIALPASVGLVLVRRPLAAAVLQGGSFARDDTANVAFVLAGYAAGVWAYTLVHVLTRAFYARGEGRTPVRVALAMVALNVVLNVTLIWTPLREAALAWSTASCGALQAVILLRLAARRLDAGADTTVLRSWAVTAGLTIVMATVVLLLVPVRALPATWHGALAPLGAAVLLGGLVHAGGALVLGRPELRWAMGRE